MDERRHVRFLTLLCVQLLTLLLAGGLIWYITANVQKSNEARIGVLIQQYPEDEQAILGAFDEKEENAEGTTNAEDVGDIEDTASAEARGSELLNKYGKNGIFEAEKRILLLSVGGFIVLFCGNIAGTWIVLKKNKKEESTTQKERNHYKEAYDDLQTKYEQMKQHMEKEEKDTKSLVTDISHQLKTPIASMKMSHEILLSTELTEEELEEFRQKETDELNKLELLLQSLMNLSKLETKLIQIKPVMADFKDTVRRAVSSIYMRAMEKDILIEMETFPNIRLLHDPKWTEEVFVNILDNAVKYSPEHTRIQICGQELVTCLLIEIEDEGIGIPPEERHKIFQRFYRGKNVEMNVKEGSGVGLYLARRILEEQRGTICVKEAAKQGSIFQITFPK